MSYNGQKEKIVVKSCVKYYSATKKDKLLINLKAIMLSERSKS